MFDKALGLLNNHLGDLHVTGWRFIKGTGNHFAAHRALHVGYFLRTLVDQQHNQTTFRIVAGNGLRNVLQQERLTGFGWRYNQTTLAFTDGRRQIDDAGAEIFGAAITQLEAQALSREQWGQVFEEDFLFGVFGFCEVNFRDL